MKKKVRYFQIGICETKFSMIFRIRPTSKYGSMGFEILDGIVASENEEQAATTMKTILKNALVQAGFKEKNESQLRTDRRQI